MSMVNKTKILRVSSVLYGALFLAAAFILAMTLFSDTAAATSATAATVATSANLLKYEYMIKPNWRTRWIIRRDGASIEEETFDDFLLKSDGIRGLTENRNAFNEINMAYIAFNNFHAFNNSFFYNDQKPQYDYFYSNDDSISRYGGAGEKVGMRGEFENRKWREGVLLDVEWIASSVGFSKIEYYLEGEHYLQERAPTYFFSETALFTAGIGEHISYFDGERAIVGINIGERTISRINTLYGGSDMRTIQQYKYKLEDINNNVLTQDFDYLAPADREADAAVGFIGIRDERIELLDYNGKVLKSTVKPPGVNEINALVNGLFIYTFNTVENTSDTLGDELWMAPDSVSETLLDSNLETLIPLGKYASIYARRYYDDGKPVELLFCDKFIRFIIQDYGNYRDRKAVFRTDVYSTSGELMIENLTQVFDVKPDRIAVIQGSYGGLMDWSGNWIVRKPIYTNLTDD